MSGTAPTDPNEDSFADLLRQGIKELREERGPCPSSEDLVAFHDGRLAAEQVAHVQNHVEACGLCDAQLGRLEAAERPLWRRISEAIWAFARRPAVAYGLVVLLLWPAYLGLLGPAKNTETKPELGIEPIPSYSLDVVRSEAQTQKSPFFRLAGDEKSFLLSFFIPLKTSPPYRYEIVVVREDETPVVPTQALKNCDKAGNCFVLCNAALFPPGRYELRVTESGPKEGKLLPPFKFQITH